MAHRLKPSAAAASAYEFVPSGVIEKASLHDMIYAACPRCFTSMSAQLQLQPPRGAGAMEAVADQLRVECASCGTSSRLNALQYKYRLKLQVIYGTTVADVMLFDEVAQTLLGVPAARMKQELLPKHPSLPWLLEELLVGLHVSFYFQRRAPKRSAQQTQYTRDLKVVKMEPLAPALLPKPAVALAIDYLMQQQHPEGDD